MSKFSPWIKWILILIAGVGLVLLSAWSIYGQKSTQGASDQEITYSHRVHVQAGIQCLYCHSEATRSTIAGIPSVQKCMGCHSAIATESEAVQDLNSYWEQGKTIFWSRANNQPDFVYFSHQPHVSGGVNCESCHGNVGEMDLAEVTIKMDMGWCLNCHEKQEPEKITRLFDCLICHK